MANRATPGSASDDVEIVSEKFAWKPPAPLANWIGIANLKHLEACCFHHIVLHQLRYT